MFPKSLVLLSLAAGVFANPAPQATDLNALAASLSSELGSVPTLDTASLNSELAAATGILSILSDLPTLPASINSVIATAIPASDLTASDFACSVTAADWYTKLPGDVKTALSSYDVQLSSWAKKHSSDIASYTSHYATGSYTTGSYALPICTGAASANKAGSTTSTTTGSSNTGGPSVSPTQSPGAAPHATGAIAGSFAGVVGVLGLLAVL